MSLPFQFSIVRRSPWSKKKLNRMQRHENTSSWINSNFFNVYSIMQRNCKHRSIDFRKHKKLNRAFFVTLHDFFRCLHNKYVSIMKTRNEKDFVKVEMTVHKWYKIIITRPCPQSTKNPQKRWLQILSQVQEILKYFSLEQLNIFLTQQNAISKKITTLDETL